MFCYRMIANIAGWSSGLGLFNRRLFFCFFNSTIDTFDWLSTDIWLTGLSDRTPSTQSEASQTYCKLSILPACSNPLTIYHAFDLPISSSCNKTLIKSSLLQLVICRLCWKKFVASLWITSFDNQLATDLPASHAKASWYRLFDDKSVARRQ